MTASVLCRFRTASPYMQPGQLLPLWLIWALCWSQMQKCPQKTRSLFLSLFSPWSCLFGELQEKQQKIPPSGWIFTWTKHWWDLCRFVLENSFLDKYLRHILSIYPAVIWALTGVFTKNYNTAKPTRNNVFNGEKEGVFHDRYSCILRVFLSMTDTFSSAPVALLGLSCTLLALRLVLVIWKNMKKPLLEDASPEVMSPMEIAERQKKIYMWKCWCFDQDLVWGFFFLQRWGGFIVYVALNLCFLFFYVFSGTWMLLCWVSLGKQQWNDECLFQIKKKGD